MTTPVTLHQDSFEHGPAGWQCFNAGIQLYETDKSDFVELPPGAGRYRMYANGQGLPGTPEGGAGVADRELMSRWGRPLIARPGCRYRVSAWIGMVAWTAGNPAVHPETYLVILTQTPDGNWVVRRYEKYTFDAAKEAGRWKQVHMDWTPQEGLGMNEPIKLRLQSNRGQSSWDLVRFEQTVGPPLPKETTRLRVTPYWGRTVSRAGQEELLHLRVEALGPIQGAVRAQAVMTGASLRSPQSQSSRSWIRRPLARATRSGLDRMQELHPNVTFTWRVRAGRPGTVRVRFRISGGGAEPASAVIERVFTPPVASRRLGYAPAPVAVKPADGLVLGVIHFPGWTTATPWATGWSAVEPFPDRMPALGWYDEKEPRVVDWEVKWALEHGLQAFLYCWYREPGNEGKPIRHFLGEAIHGGLLKSRYINRFRFAIMWENQPGFAGIRDMDDLRQRLMPYWLQHYLRHPSCLRINGVPVLAIYRIERLAADLGGADRAREAVGLLKQMARNAGLGGLWVISEYRGDDEPNLRLQAECGADASFAYCYNVPRNYTGTEAVNRYLENLTNRSRRSPIPVVATVPVRWDPGAWEEYSGNAPSAHWRVNTAQYREMARRVRAHVLSQPAGSLQRQLVLFDNWNEWGEGHYIAPCREFGFDYLDAIRDVFTGAPRQHVDRLPEEAGCFDLDSTYRRWKAGLFPNHRDPLFAP